MSFIISCSGERRFQYICSEGPNGQGELEVASFFIGAFPGRIGLNKGSVSGAGLI